MRIPLVGPSSTAFSLAVSAQQSLNCYLETIETVEGKNKYVMRGRPGMRLFKDLTAIDAGATAVRGLWSCAGATAGSGRLFVAAGTKFFELDISGNLVGLVSTIADDGTHPAVDILPNGNQLFVVSSGLSYCSNGLGLVQNTLPALSGTSAAVGGGLLSWDNAANSSTGNTDQFDIGMLGQTITWNGNPYTISAITNPTLILVTPNPGLSSAKDWSCTPVLNAGRGAFLDGYFVVNRPQSRQFNISNLLDGSTWSGLDFALKEGYPDNIVAPWTEPPLLYMLGQETAEIYRNTGNASFPMERVDGGFARVGLVAPYSCVSIMGKLHMLAGGNFGQVVAVRMEGATPVRISTHAVEEALKGIAFSGYQGISYSYIERGHWFWVIGIQGGNSWVYDATESLLQGSPQWHERATWTAGAFADYKPQVHTFVTQWNGGTHIVGGLGEGKLYTLDSDFFDDNVTDIRCVRALPYVYNEGKRIFFKRIDFELETGTSGTPPVVTLDWSDDRGRTWGTGLGAGTHLTLGPGVTGVYTTRYYAVGLGSSLGRVFRIAIQGQGRVALIDAQLEAVMATS